tara:strand:- start:235 stop:525 length:291 start_codon:yes stop_codon:yes gene_type:complete
MDNIIDYIASSSTGRLNIVGSNIQSNKVQSSIKTSDEAAAERNKKVNKNEYICDNIDTSNEGFSNCNVRYNYHNNFILFFIFILSLVFLYYIYKML